MLLISCGAILRAGGKSQEETAVTEEEFESLDAFICASVKAFKPEYDKMVQERLAERGGRR